MIILLIALDNRNHPDKNLLKISNTDCCVHKTNKLLQQQQVPSTSGYEKKRSSETIEGFNYCSLTYQSIPLFSFS